MTGGDVWASWIESFPISSALELTDVAPEPIREGIVYVGECVEQSARRHRPHRQIGSLTLMNNLAALFRESCQLRASRQGNRLEQPGLDRLLGWIDAHLTATTTARHHDVATRDVLAALDPCLLIVGWDAKRTGLRKHLSE